MGDGGGRGGGGGALEWSMFAQFVFQEFCVVAKTRQHSEKTVMVCEEDE